MKRVITEEQRREIVNLAENHLDALIAYGADLYRDGLRNGAIATLTGVIAVGICGPLLCKTVKFVKSKYRQNKVKD